MYNLVYNIYCRRMISCVYVTQLCAPGTQLLGDEMTERDEHSARMKMIDARNSAALAAALRRDPDFLKKKYPPAEPATTQS